MPNHSFSKHHYPSPNTLNILNNTYKSPNTNHTNHTNKHAKDWDSSISNLNIHKLNDNEYLIHKLSRLNKDKLINILTPVINNINDNKKYKNSNNNHNINNVNKENEINNIESLNDNDENHSDNSISESDVKKYSSSKYLSSFNTPIKNIDYTANTPNYNSNTNLKSDNKLPDLFSDYQKSNNHTMANNNGNNNVASDQTNMQTLEEQVLNFQIPKIDFVSIYGEPENEKLETSIVNKDDDEKLKMLETIEKLKLRLDSYDVKQEIENSFREKIFETVNNFNEQLKLMAEQMDQLKMENQTLKSKVQELERNKTDNITVKENFTPFRSHHKTQNLPEEPSVAPSIAPTPYPSTPFRYASVSENSDNTDRYLKANSVKFSNPISTPAPQPDNESSSVPTSILGRTFLKRPSPAAVSVDMPPVKLFQSPAPNDIIVKQGGSKFEC